jgi:hypothetical protein
VDQKRFDRITRTLASGSSRRGMVRTLSGIGVGGVLTAVGRGNAEAAPCKPPNQRCPKGGDKTCYQNCTACIYEACDPSTDVCCGNGGPCTVRQDCRHHEGEDFVCC